MKALSSGTYQSGSLAICAKCLISKIPTVSYKRRVDKPEYEDEDDEAFFNDIFGDSPEDVIADAGTE